MSTDTLELSLTDEEKIEVATEAVQRFIDIDAPWREVVEGVANAIADAATAMAGVGDSGVAVQRRFMGCNVY